MKAPKQNKNKSNLAIIPEYTPMNYSLVWEREINLEKPSLRQKSPKQQTKSSSRSKLMKLFYDKF